MGKWVDKDNGWVFNTDKIYKNTVGEQILRYVGDVKEFSSNNSYFYKIGIDNLSNLPAFSPSISSNTLTFQISNGSESAIFDTNKLESGGSQETSFPIQILIAIRLIDLTRDFIFNKTVSIDFFDLTETFSNSNNLFLSKLQNELDIFKNNILLEDIKTEYGDDATLDPTSLTTSITNNKLEIFSPKVDYINNSGQQETSLLGWTVGTFMLIREINEENNNTKGFGMSVNWNDSYKIQFSGNASNTSFFPSNTEGFIYFNSSPINTSETNNYINFDSTSLFNQNFGIKNIEVNELQWGITGLSWINDNPDLSTLNSRGLSNESIYCNGWCYNNNSDLFVWYNLNTTTSKYNPIGNVPKVENENYNTINYIYKYIGLQNFNLSLQYNKSEGPDSGTISRDNNAGFKIYISDKKPPIISDINIFNNYLDNSILLEEINDIGNLNINYIGLTGNRYVLFVGDVPENNKDSLIVLSNIKIQGEYFNENNKLFNLDVLSDEITKDIDGALYSSIVGNGEFIEDDEGNNIKNTIEPKELISKIGNSYFNRGIWEYGVWNSGYRNDDSVKEMYDITFSVKTISDKRWIVRISGPESSIVSPNPSESLKIGDKISISNIIGIDINENRKPLTESYKITEISNEYIDIEIDTTFPLRRIERDSTNHRILITKNIWLSGGFLNGFFKGIWNYGLFKGFPIISKMENSHWIEGIFDGGHFKGNEILFGEFEDTFYSDGLVGIKFENPHNLSTSDRIIIDKDNKDINPQYDGEHDIIEIKSPTEIIIDLVWGQNLDGESGSYRTKYSNALLQKLQFKSNNKSNITSNVSLNSPSVFKYNSWLDVNYYDHSAINIGKPQTVLNKNSRNYFSENNLYGYPTNDILESKSVFRDSFSLEERTYSLGVKYKKFNDFIGESSKFNDFFGSEGDDLDLFLEKGWDFSVANIPPQNITPSIIFNRTESLGGISDIEGGQLNIRTIGNGGILDIDKPSVEVRNRSLSDIMESRYTVIEFDLVNFDGVSDEYLPLSDNSNLNLSEPIIHFDNINKINRLEIDELGEETVELRSATYLPITDNINHIKTPNKRKIEYFFNKRHLSMNIRGNGNRGENISDLIIDNLKIFEVNMIPFFKYFLNDNINKSIQIPLVGISNYIEFDDLDESEIIRNLDFNITEIELNDTDINFENSGINIEIIDEEIPDEDIFEVLPNSPIVVEGDVFSFNLSVIANIPWTIGSRSSFITSIISNGVNIDSGNGNASLEVNLESNDSFNDRNGDIIFNSGDISVTKTFTQESSLLIQVPGDPNTDPPTRDDPPPAPNNLKFEALLFESNLITDLCNMALINADSGIYFRDGDSFEEATILFTDINGVNVAPTGWYGFNNFTGANRNIIWRRFINPSSSFFGNPIVCNANDSSGGDIDDNRFNPGTIDGSSNDGGFIP